MVRKKRDSGKDSFELTPEKANKLHDDRAYVCALLGYALLQERRNDILKKSKKNAESAFQYISITPPRRSSIYNC